MMWNLLKIFLIVLSFFHELRSSNESILEQKYGKLLHVSAIFRHGERSPVVTYPRDPHILHSWPDGLGQLLKSGKLSSYNLGKWFRKNYKQLLNPIQTHTNIKVDSSDMDRTIMSAQYFMASFYFPNSTQGIAKNIRWRPIPIHTSSITEENYVWVNAPCSKSTKLKEKFFQRSKMLRNYDRNKKLLEYLQKHTGFSFSRDKFFIAVWKLYHIWDVLNIQKIANLTLPTWTKKVFPNRIEKLMNLFLHKEFNDRRILRLTIGPLLKSIKEDLVSNSNVSRRSWTKKFHFYSGHDDSIASLMYALGNYDGVNPTYSSALIFELRRRGTKNIVQVKYLKSVKSSAQLLNIPRCGNPCTLQKFVKIIRSLLVENWKAECQLKKK